MINALCHIQMLIQMQLYTLLAGDRLWNEVGEEKQRENLRGHLGTEPSLWTGQAALQ